MKIINKSFLNTAEKDKDNVWNVTFCKIKQFFSFEVLTENSWVEKKKFNVYFKVRLAFHKSTTIVKKALQIWNSWFKTLNRSSRLGVLCKKSLLKDFTKLYNEVLFLVRLQVWAFKVNMQSSYFIEHLTSSSVPIMNVSNCKKSFISNTLKRNNVNNNFFL